jgi:hypothetical protein
MYMLIHQLVPLISGVAGDTREDGPFRFSSSRICLPNSLGVSNPPQSSASIATPVTSSKSSDAQEAQVFVYRQTTIAFNPLSSLIFLAEFNL